MNEDDLRLLEEWIGSWRDEPPWDVQLESSGIIDREATVASRLGQVREAIEAIGRCRGLWEWYLAQIPRNPGDMYIEK